MQTATTLQAQVEFLQEKLDEQNKIIEQKNQYIVHLEEWIKQQRQQRFGASSEKVSPNQLGLFNEAEAIEQEAIETAEDAVTVVSHTRHKKPRVSIPDDLPRETIIHDLPDDRKTCPHDGAALAVTITSLSLIHI